MAWVVGTMLLFVYFFAHVGHSSIVGYHTSKSVEDVIGPIHGALYIVYLLTVVQLWIKFRLRPLTLALMIVAGWLPFTAFVGERRVMRLLALQPASA